jgi:hypothetical protein
MEKKQVYIEHDGALFRGFGRAHPQEVWHASKGWVPYKFEGGYKPVEWGSVISEAEANELMGEAAPKAAAA